MPMSDTQRTLVEAQGFYLTGEDNLRLTTIGTLAGVTVAIEARRVDEAGRIVPFAERHNPSSNYSVVSTLHQIGSGSLLNAQLRVTAGAAVRGHVFAILEVVRGLSGAVQPLATLLQGYVTANARLAWPGSPIEASVSGAGRIRSITGTNPAAGAQISETVPAGVRWRFILATFGLTTDANVANRLVAVVFDDGVSTLAQVGDNATQAASQTHTYVVGAWGQISPFGAGIHSIPIPEGLFLPAGARVRTTIGSGQVGDDFTAPQLLVEEFLEG